MSPRTFTCGRPARKVVVLLDPVSVREVERMKPKAVAQAVSIVGVHRAKMLRYWRETHE
jgi:hypothetical protein